jgi:thioredoxin reductase (NADPH)
LEFQVGKNLGGSKAATVSSSACERLRKKSLCKQEHLMSFFSLKSTRETHDRDSRYRYPWLRLRRTHGGHLHRARRLNPLVLEGHEPGGQLSMTTLVENFPGWPEGIQGPELIDNMKKQAARFGATFQLAHLVSVDLSANPIRLQTSAGEILTRTLIVASGASARWLGLPSEQALIGHGVSSCATCDGFFFRGKEIAVVGGGDSAMEEALFLTRFASRSRCCIAARSSAPRRSCSTASMRIPDRSAPQHHHRRSAGRGREGSLGLRLRDVDRRSQRARHHGLFLGIGHEPNAKMFAGQIDLDGDGYIKTTGNVLTTLNGAVIPGVFACGDVQDRRYRQAITAAGSGCMAALEAEKFLEEQGH